MKPEPVTLAVVDDETDIRETVSEYLEHNGFKVLTADSAAAFRRILEGNKVDLALLDVNMPGQNGLSLARYLRENLDIGIIMLTAAADTDDRIAGLELGADDYLGKPFDLEELAARVRAISRRNSGRAAPQATYNGVTLNPARLTVAVNGECIGLSRREFAVLAALMDRPGTVLSKSDLEAKLYGWQEEVESNTVEVHVHKLRSKIGRAKIETLRGIGYRMRPIAS